MNKEGFVMNHGMLMLIELLRFLVGFLEALVFVIFYVIFGAVLLVNVKDNQIHQHKIIQPMS